jgi:omega-amidase
MNLTISLAQMHIEFGQVRKNFDRVRKMTGAAARAGSQVILLPELWSSGYDLSRSNELAGQNQELLPEIAQLASDCSITIAGSLLIGRDEKVFNTFLFFSPGQSEPVVYEKAHLFRLMDEGQYLAPGSSLRTLDAPWGRTGLAICYDLRFPEMFRSYAINGASLVFISAEWPLRRIRHWQVLLRARAVENQCFVAAVNSVKETGGTVFGGRSAVISPWGEAIVECGSGAAGLVTAVLDLSEVDAARQAIPVLQDRRPDLYGL